MKEGKSLTKELEKTPEKRGISNMQMNLEGGVKVFTNFYSIRMLQKVPKTHTTLEVDPNIKYICWVFFAKQKRITTPGTRSTRNIQ